jgi:hypothetical protein
VELERNSSNGPLEIFGLHADLQGALSDLGGEVQVSFMGHTNYHSRKLRRFPIRGLPDLTTCCPFGTSFLENFCGDVQMRS